MQVRADRPQSDGLTEAGSPNSTVNLFCFHLPRYKLTTPNLTQIKSIAVYF